MPPSGHIFRCAAILLLLITGVGLVTCETLCGGSCELAGSPGDSHSGIDDACLCCCPHVEIATLPDLKPAQESLALAPAPSPILFSVESPSIYHPPQA